VPHKGIELISLIKIMNKRGPRMEPWGTPDSKGRLCDVVPFRTTACVLSVR